jgi:hypothetical protein
MKWWYRVSRVKIKQIRTLLASTGDFDLANGMREEREEKFRSTSAVSASLVFITGMNAARQNGNLRRQSQKETPIGFLEDYAIGMRESMRNSCFVLRHLAIMKMLCRHFKLKGVFYSYYTFQLSYVEAL